MSWSADCHMTTVCVYDVTSTLGLFLSRSVAMVQQKRSTCLSSHAHCIPGGVVWEINSDLHRDEGTNCI